jgi:hypothetical protein
MTMIELARKLNRKGDLFLSKNGAKDFHKYAADLLADSKLPEAFDYQEIVHSVFDPKSLHKQSFRNLEFSDLPVTLSHGEHCFIDLYFWRRRPTTIHNHHFTGAFMCLLGQNLDLEYSFKKEQKIGKYHEVGSLAVEHVRKLLPGDVAPIAFLDKFIHQNHHQADLTVNVCFRTPENPKKSLSNYLSSGLRYEKNGDLLGRIARLRRFLDIGDFNSKSITITDDDAVAFLIQNLDIGIQNPRILKIMKNLDKRIKNEYGVNVARLLKLHDLELKKQENEYE